MIMKHPIDKKFYKSRDSVIWKLATIDDVYNELNKIKQNIVNISLKNEKLKELLTAAKEEIQNDMSYTDFNEIGKLTLIKQIEEFTND